MIVAQQEDIIHKTVNKLMDKGAAVFDLDNGIKLYTTLNNSNRNWLIDTYLFSDNAPVCYSAKGIEQLKRLATEGQFSDGVLKVEKNDRQSFTLRFVDDLASSFHWTVSVWVSIIEKLVQNKEFISTIHTNWKRYDPRIWSY